MEKLRSGSTVSGYILTDLLGAGGFASVYKARSVGPDAAFGSFIAVKILHPRRIDRTMVQKFREEARTSLALRHENIITVHDFQEFEGNFLILMELADDDLGRFAHKSPLSFEQIMSVMKRAGQGLAFAHRKGIVHRDFTPSNILVSGGLASVKITDFGISGKANIFLRSILPGQPDSQSGTQAYFAPEQYRGTYDKRTDVYAFGKTLNSLFRHSSIPVPSRIAHIIKTATQPEPGERFQEIEQLLYFLETAEKSPELDRSAAEVLLAAPVPRPAAPAAPRPAASAGPDLSDAGEFVVRVANMEHAAEPVKTDGGTDLVFSLSGNGQAAAAVLNRRGEVVFTRKGRRYVFSAAFRSAGPGMLIAGEPSPVIAERRQEMRVATSSAVAEVRIPGLIGSRTVRGTVANICSRGARLKIAEQLRAGRSYETTLRLDGKECAVSFVVREADERDGSCSIAFTGMSAKDARRLEAFLGQHSRREAPPDRLANLRIDSLWKKP